MFLSKKKKSAYSKNFCDSIHTHIPSFLSYNEKNDLKNFILKKKNVT